jgi:hypothetical protein
MSDDLVKKWVAALRSGEYKQGKGYLKYVEGGKTLYCCLGVLCELTGPGVVEKREYGEPILDRICTKWNEQSCLLPESVKNAAGLYSDCGSFDGGVLMNLNDSGIPFNEIADLIESRPAGLFKETFNEAS